MVFGLGLVAIALGSWDVLIWNSIGMKVLGLTCVLIGNVLVWISGVAED